MSLLDELLKRAAERHDHLCPRQVLGVRMGMAGMAALRLSSPVTKPTGHRHRRDRWVLRGRDRGLHRRLRRTSHAAALWTWARYAATFVDVQTGKALRLAPRPGIRTLAFKYAAQTEERYQAQLRGYQLMPDNELLEQREIRLQPSLQNCEHTRCTRDM